HCLGTGIRDSLNARTIDKPLRCFDMFKNTNQRMNGFINQFFFGYIDANANMLPSQFDNSEVKSFRQIFDYQTASVKEFIEVYEGSILDFDVSQLQPDQFEIVNVDVGKSFELNEFIIRSFFPGVITDGYVFQQDIGIPDHWYLLFTMHLLRDHFALDFVKRPSGWVYRCTKPISHDSVNTCIEVMSNVTPAETIEHYYECRSVLPEDLHTTANLCFCFCYLEKFGMQLDRPLPEVLQTFNVDPERDHFASIERLCKRLGINS
ncbi:MAG: hypothetical protein AAGA30_18915, partial [Planctomycetota bacterium]